MYGGKLRKVKFKYSGLSIENVLDKLPTAKILNEKDGIYTIRAEVYGEGFKMWARSQGESRSEERRVGKECRSRWSPYH